MALHLLSEEARKWWTLAAVAFGLFMIMLDDTVVNVALPSMAQDLGLALAGAVVSFVLVRPHEEPDWHHEPVPEVG